MERLLFRLLWISYSLQQWLIQKFTLTGFIVGYCILLSGAVGVDTYRTLAYQIFTFLVSLLSLSILLTQRFFLPLKITIITPRFGTVGIPLKYRITIDNPTKKVQRGLKLWQNFADPRPHFEEFKESLQQVKKREKRDRVLEFLDKINQWLWLIAYRQCATSTIVDLPPLAGYRKTEVKVELIPQNRGVVKLKGISIACLDPLGLCYGYQRFSVARSILVLPQIYPVAPIQLPGLRKYQSGGVALASSVGDAEEFRSLREYRQGDPLRKIHWKSWAKIGKPIVKEDQEEFFVRHALILDTFQTTKYSNVLESAISVSASLACEIQTQESLLDLMFVGLETYCFTFGRGLSHTDKMLEILASVIPCQEQPFSAIITAVTERLERLSGCICVLLGWDQERQKLIRYLQTMGIGILVIVIQEKTHPVWIENKPDYIHVLTVGELGEGLLKL